MSAERPSDPHAAQGRDHVETILQALDHLLDAECYGPASLLTWAEEGIAALDALIAERDEAENLAAIHDGRAQSLATEVERLEALELEAALPQHASDCATNNEPALPRGDCDCRPDLGDPAAVIAYYTHLVAGLLAERQQDSAAINRFAPDYPARPSLRAWLRMPRSCWRLVRSEGKRLRKLRRLTYAYSRCECGALYAYDPREKPRPTAWDCSDILLGVAIPKGEVGSVRHSDLMPFVFWKVKEAKREWALANRRVSPLEAESRG